MMRMLYTDPLVHLIIDFITEHQIAEVFSFAFLHQIEEKRKQVQAVLTILKNDGILNTIE